MPKTRLQYQESLADLLEISLTTTEVQRLIHDITTCTVEWEAQPAMTVAPHARGLEFFPCHALYFQRHPLEIKGSIYPNLATGDGEGLSHLVRLALPDIILDLKLHTSQTTFLLSPFHIRFLSILFGRLVLHHLSQTPEGKAILPSFTPYSLEEQVVAGYLQSLEWAPCATIKLDAQDNPYIGSLLHSAAALKRCEMPGSPGEEGVIRAWRLFKRLLYYSVEGERLVTGFAILSATRPLEYYRKRWPQLLLYHAADHTYLDEGLQSIKQFLLNADGRITFLALYGGKIIGLLQVDQGSHRQLTAVKPWRTVLPLATISYRGRVNFWIALKGRHNPRIPLSVLEYRHGHLHIPLFQDIFWQELERQLNEVCHGPPTDYFPRMKNLLQMIRRRGHGAILLVGLTDQQLQDPDLPMENQVRLAQPAPLSEKWQRHLLGLSRSDGALIFNDRLEASQFRARLKATVLRMAPERGDLGSGIRHQVTREFTAYCPTVLGICVSQDGHISLYRNGKLVSRLF
jgi:hypothetical protein